MKYLCINDGCNNQTAKPGHLCTACQDEARRLQKNVDKESRIDDTLNMLERKPRSLRDLWRTK